MNLRSVDLNLFVVLEALLEERSVTRAASRVGLSQPALSNALGRLRDLFDDPLLIRTARGMQPTPRATELAEDVSALLHQVRRVLNVEDEFDPATAEHRFSIRMGDMNEFIFLPRIIAALRRQAPRVTLEIKHLSPELTLQSLESGEIELALSTGLHHGPSIRSLDLAYDQTMLALRKDHPFTRARDKAAAFHKLQHIRVSQSPADTRFLDDYLADRKLRRQVIVTLPHWLAAPSVVAQTDLVTVVSERMAARLGRRVATLPLPFGPQPFTWMLYWHRRHEAHPANRWLRSLIRKVAAE